MLKISALTLDWMDAIGYCSCTPPKDDCADCKARRQAMRRWQVQQPKKPTVFTGRVPTDRKLDLG